LDEVSSNGQRIVDRKDGVRKTRVALASAAAIVTATPSILPTHDLAIAGAPTSATADLKLTGLADLLAITPAQWTQYYFSGYGPFLQSTDTPFTISNPSALVADAYAALDALINGNGNPDPTTWPSSLVNYHFETGPVGASYELLQQTVGAANPGNEERPSSSRHC